MGRKDTNHFPAQTAKILFTLAKHVVATGPQELWIGRAWQADGSEHQTGRALDIICSTQVGLRPTAAQKQAGNTFCAWLIEHASTLHIRHIIWNDRIWKARYASQGWRQFTGDRSSLTSRHEDHVHVLLQDADGAVPGAPITTSNTTNDWSILMADLPQNVRADIQIINESAIQHQLVQEGRAPTLNEIASAVVERLLGTWLGASGPTVAVALQDGITVERANAQRLDSIEQRLAAIEGRG